MIELAETRSVARALRFAGYGLEYCGAEEVSHLETGETNEAQSRTKSSESVFPDGNGQGNVEQNTPNGRNGRATSAQCRALFALTKKARYTDEDIESMLKPLNASTFQELTRESASQLITVLQTEAAA